MEIRSTATLVNERGLHARPCHAIAMLAVSHSSALYVAHAGREVDGRSMLELLTLCAPHGAVLALRAEGDDARELLSRLEALLAGGFGELD